MTDGLKYKIENSIALLKKAEKLAKRYDPENGFYLAFSGGKDSQALYHLAVMGGYYLRHILVRRQLTRRNLYDLSAVNIRMLNLKR